MTDNPYQEPSPETGMSDVRNASGCSWKMLLLALGIVVVLIALLLPALRRSGDPPRRAQCRNNLKQIGLALHNYHEVYDALPPAYTVDVSGKPLHSWRTLILPYLDQANVYKTIDLTKPWDDPVNTTAYATTIPAYTCPSVADLPAGHTTYLGLVGPDRGFLPTESRTLYEFVSTSETLIVAEVSPEYAVHWMAPQDGDGKLFLTFDESTELVHAYGLQALRADGSAILVGPDTPANERREWLSVAKDRLPLEAETRSQPADSTGQDP